jgi:NitT/TauT family transport system substrate-binding protein
MTTSVGIVSRALLGAAIGALAFGSVVQAQELKEINFMSSNDGSCSVYPQFAMQAFGFLEKEGYKLNLLSSDTSVPYVAFLANGDADVAMLDAIETLTARAQGQDIKVVYETHQFAPEGIVVLADSPTRSPPRSRSTPSASRSMT